MLEGLRLPLMCAPMSFASSVPLAVACCKAGVIGGWQGGTYTPDDAFEAYLKALDGIGGAPPIVNIPARWGSDPKWQVRLDMMREHRVPLVLSSLGDPSALVGRVHEWGGRVIQDVTTMKHAEKAIAAGVDGLMLTCAGAGGHTGFLTPMAFVPAVRRIWGGLLIVAGGIADVHGIAGALALGGDIAAMGTRFIATVEANAPDEYKQAIVTSEAEDITYTNLFTGVHGNYLRSSIEKAGLDPENLPVADKSKMNFGSGGNTKVKAWRDIWGAGQSAGPVKDVPKVAELVDRLEAEYRAAGAKLRQVNGF